MRFGLLNWALGTFASQVNFSHNSEQFRTIQNNCGYDILKYVTSGAISVVVYKICLESEVVELFFSYCHKDEDYRNEMEVHLSLLKRQGVISTWHDRRIVVGSEIDADINTHLESANVIVLLVDCMVRTSSLKYLYYPEDYPLQSG